MHARQKDGMDSATGHCAYRSSLPTALLIDTRTVVLYLVLGIHRIRSGQNGSAVKAHKLATRLRDTAV